MTPETEAYGLLALVTLMALELGGRFAASRFVFRLITQSIMRVDLAMVGLVRRLHPPRYELVGACQKRGACCTQIVADPPLFVKNRWPLTAAYLGMHRLLHNFHLAGRGPEGQLIMRCGFLKTDGRCGIYRFRPRLCRTYPLLPFFTAPALLPGCGYRVKLRSMQSHPRMPIVMPHVGTHHPTPVRRAGQELEYVEDFRLVTTPGGEKWNKMAAQKALR